MFKSTTLIVLFALVAMTVATSFAEDESMSRERRGFRQEAFNKAKELGQKGVEFVKKEFGKAKQLAKAVVEKAKAGVAKLG